MLRENNKPKIQRSMIGIKVDWERWLSFRAFSIERDRTATDMLEEAMRDYVKRHRKREETEMKHSPGNLREDFTELLLNDFLADEKKRQAMAVICGKLKSSRDVILSGVRRELDSFLEQYFDNHRPLTVQIYGKAAQSVLSIMENA